MAIEQGITIHRGADYLLDIELEKADKSPLNPSGGVLTYYLSDKAGGTLLETLTDTDISTAEASGGIWFATLKLTAAITVLLAPGTYYHELVFEDALNQRSILLFGGVAVLASQVAEEE